MRKIESVLLVDDDFASNYLTNIIIEDMNFVGSTHIVRDGKAAVDFMQQFCLPQQTGTTLSCPDLILLDINMPVMDGFEFLDEFEKMTFADDKQILIVLLTTSTNVRDIGKAKKYQVSGYIEKPITEEKLKKVLEPFNIAGI